MEDPALQYYATSEQPGQIEELRNDISAAKDPSALLAAAYAVGLGSGVDLWAASSVDYPSASVWFYSRLPMDEELVEQQVADISRQVSLARSEDAELSVMIFRPHPVVTTVMDHDTLMVDGVVHYRDFVVFAADRPQALVRLGALAGDNAPHYEELLPVVELVGTNLATVVRRSGSLETLQLIVGRADRTAEEFFELLEMAMVEVHQHQEEMSLMAIRIKAENGEAERKVSDEQWQQIWELLQDNLRETDLPSQLRPGQYIVAMLATDPREAMITAARLRTRLHNLGQSYGLKLRASIGISNWSVGRPEVGQLIWEARQALEMAIASGAENPFVYA